MAWMLRPYTAGDAGAVAEVINAAITDMDGLNEAAREHIRASNSTERLHGDLSGWATLIATEEGEVVGVGALDRNEITRVYIHPDAARRGIASAIVESLESAARAARLDAVRLDASPSSVAFYESLGYVASAPRADEIGDAIFRFVPMPKRL